MQIIVRDEYMTSSIVQDDLYYVGNNNATHYNVEGEHRMHTFSWSSGRGFTQIERFTIKRGKRC